MLEVLHGSFVFFCRRAAAECAEISPLSGVRIGLAGIKTVLA
jgi:hypothetical protein